MMTHTYSMYEPDQDICMKLFIMKELYREIKINKHGLRFLPKLSLSGLAEVVYFYLLI